MTEPNPSPAGDKERMHALVVTLADDLRARCIAKGVPPDCVASGLLVSTIPALAETFGAENAAMLFEHMARRLRSASALMAAEPAGHA